MKRLAYFFSIWLCCASLVPAQEAAPGNVALDYWQTVRMTDSAAFENGFKQHMAWRKEQGDPWTWNTWQLIRGERLGLYLTSSPNHQWADFDNEPLGDAAGGHYMTTAGQYVESFGATNSITLRQWSQFPKEPLKAGTLAAVYVLSLKPDKAEQFQDAIRRFHESVTKAGWDTPYIWIATAYGGPPDIALVLPRPNWASMSPDAKSPEKVVEEAFGPIASRELFRQISGAIAAERIEVWLYRPDLSYAPE